MLSRTLGTIAIALVPALARGQQLEEYAVDPGHSIIEFAIPFAFTHVKGRFTDWRGTVLYDRSNPSRSSVTVVIDAKSIDTGWPHRDEHLKTSDLFDVERFPKIVFQSDSVRTKSGGLVADGRLTMHGVARPLSLPIRLVAGGPQRSTESGHLMLDAASTIRVARADFGITGGSKYNSWFDSAQRGRTLAGTPGPVWPSYYRGGDLTVRALVASGRVPDAIILAGALASLFETYPSHVLHGYALDVAGDHRGATAAFARAKARYAPPAPSNEQFKQDDEEWWWLNQLALTALERGERRPAADVARLLTELYPTQSRAFVTLGRALAANNDTPGAAAAFATALRLDAYETRAMEWSRRVDR